VPGLRIAFWIRLCLLACLAGWLGTAQAHLVCVVSGDKTPAFLEASDSLTQELVRSGIARQDIEVLSVAEYLDGGQRTADNRLIVSLGTDAFRQVTARSGKTMVLAGLIPRIAFERVLQEANKRPPFQAAALYLDQPFGRQLDLLRLALPAVRRIGVVWGPESVTQQPLLNTALQARGLELSEGQVSEGTPLITALRSALNDAEVLLAVADGNVFNPSTVSNILLTSYRAKTAVMAFSPAYVKAGALLAVYSSATQAGAQLASMASHYLQSNSVPGNQYPSDFSISGNEYVARSLGISLDVKTLTERLRKLEKPEKRP
jgi:ABC-type uncharacterized transport system substrate-binding protein